MSLPPLIKHPGGKRKIAGVVAELLGHPDSVCELFAGGLGVSLTAGMCPAVTAEVIPAIRALYNTLATDPCSFWMALDALPKVFTEREFYALRDAFNCQGAANPAWYVALNATCFNGLARFNAGRFSTAFGKRADGKPMTRPDFMQIDGLRLMYEGAFRRRPCHCYPDWREALAAAIAQGLPVFADPPYLNTFSYAGTWGIGDLHALADALPIGALICERIEPRPAQESLFGEPQTAVGILRDRGFELVHTWTPRNNVSCGPRSKRPEGIWRKVEA